MPVPVITDIYVVEHQRLTSDSSEQRASVGLLLDKGGGVQWQLCTVRGQANRLADTVEQGVRPAWMGRPLDDPAALIADLDGLQESVQIEEKPPEVPEQRGISRRDLLTGAVLRQRTQPPPSRHVIRRQALPAPLRFALSMALLQAVSTWQRQSLAETLQVVLETEAPSSQPALLYSQAFPGRADLWRSAVGWGWRLPRSGQATSLNDASLQGALRRTRQSMEALAQEQWPQHLFLQANAWFDRYYEGDSGRILGALYGLQQVCNPLPLWIENPLPPTSERTDDWRTLHEYLRFRKLDVQLMAHSNEAEATATLARSGVLAAFRLQPAALGSLLVLKQRLQQCRAAGVPVMLAPPMPADAQAMQQTALLAGAAGARGLVVAVDEAVWLAPEAAIALQRQTATMMSRGTL